jgi:hypothetical protein
MNNGWAPKNVVLSGLVPLGASQSNAPVSNVFSLSAGGAIDGLVIALSCSGVTAGAGITAKLQSGLNGTFYDSKTVAITGNGVFFITLLGNKAADQTYLPLLAAGQVVVTTGAGSAVSVDMVQVLQPL